MSHSIPLFEIFSDEQDIKAVNEVLRRGKQWADGPEIKQFEDKLAEYINSKFVLTFNSGTSAMHASLLAYGVGKGDEVIVPSFTFISTANTVLMTGARVVFADIEEESYGLNPESVKERITKKTKAIVPVHIGGAPCKEIKVLRDIADDNDILLFEDAAEALGSELEGQMAGTFGDSAMYSFCQNKVITTGEGGAISTNSKSIYEKLRLIRSHGRQETDSSYFTTHRSLDYIQMGYNYRMPTMCAALGISQLEKIDLLIKLRQEKAGQLTEKLDKIKGLKTPKPDKNIKHIYQMYTIELEDHTIREELQKYLLDNGIMTKIYFPPIHLEPFYRKTLNCMEGMLPTTEKISKRVLTLPMHPKLTDDDINYISLKMQEFME